MKKLLMLKTCLPAVIFLLFFTGVASSEVPQLINYEGMLTDQNGVPVPNGSYDVVFSIYDVPTGGTALWVEPWNTGTTPVISNAGAFSVMLGSINPIPTSFFSDNPTTYLGIQVGTDTEMLPRQRIVSVAYAIQAGNGVPIGAIIMWSGSIAEIPEGWALCDGTNGTPDLRNRFIVGAGGDYAVNATGGIMENSVAHNHSIATESDLGTDSKGNHAHSIDFNTQGPGGSNATDSVEDGSGDTVASEDHIHRVVGNTSSTGGHSHLVNPHDHGGLSGNALNSTIENRPPYYALCFIMKL